MSFQANDDFVLKCYFASRKDYFLWKMCILFTTVNHPAVYIIPDDQHMVSCILILYPISEINKTCLTRLFYIIIKCRILHHCIIVIQVLEMTVSEEEIASKLEQLKPLFRRTTIGKLRIVIRGSTNIIRKLGDVLEGAHLNHLESSCYYSDNDL